MEGDLALHLAPVPPVDVIAPVELTLPLVCASPHSGTLYPSEFLAASRLDALTLRRSEDAYVDELFGGAPALGAPLLRARFARAYLDPNREPYELDPAMFVDALPPFVNRHSPRVRMGLGTIARVVASGEEIYARKLEAEEAISRIERLYRPYLREVAAIEHRVEAGFGSLDRSSVRELHGSGETWLARLKRALKMIQARWLGYIVTPD